MNLRSISLPGLIRSPLCAATAALILCGSSASANWPMWRGPTGVGVASEKNLPTSWSETNNIRWKVALPEGGNSTPAIWGDKVFVTQAIEKDHLRTLMCFSRTDGKLLWHREVKYEAPERTHQANPHCSASPATDGERVIAWHASAGLYCYDMNGKELWKADLGKQDFEWGSGSSPVLHGDKVFLYMGPTTNSFLTALDKKTGRTVWKYMEPDIEIGERTDGFSKDSEMGRRGGRGMVCTYSTPIVIKSGAREELVMSFPRYLRSFDLATGKVLWTADGLNPLVYTSPLYSDGMIVSVGGFFGNTVAVKAGGNGDVTETHRLWRTTKNKSGIGTGAIKEGHLYQLNNGGMVECVELKTGKSLWIERVRGTGPTSETWSSLLVAGDNFYLVNQSGNVVVFKANPEKLEIVSVNSIGNEMSNSSLAASNGELFLRTHKHLWCIGSEKSKQTAALR